MAKKKLAKTIVCLGALGVATKVAYGKYKSTKETYAKEEADSVGDEVKKYNALFEKKVIEVEDEEFTGCEIKAVSSSVVVDLGLASFEKDVYINFTSTASSLTIILPEGVNAACDVTRTASGMRNLIENVEEEGIHTVYIIGKANCSSIEVIPVNFYVDDEDDYEDISDEDDYEVVVDNTVTPKVDKTVDSQDVDVDIKDNDNSQYVDVAVAADDNSQAIDVTVADDDNSEVMSELFGDTIIAPASNPNVEEIKLNPLNELNN